jgi:hypothetical protein
MFVRCQGSDNFLNTLLTGGSDVIRLTHQLHFTPREGSWRYIPLESESTPGPSCDRKD